MSFSPYPLNPSATLPYHFCQAFFICILVVGFPLCWPEVRYKCIRTLSTILNDFVLVIVHLFLLFTLYLICCALLYLLYLCQLNIILIVSMYTIQLKVPATLRGAHLKREAKC